jgi:hypothetical protein
MDMELEKFDDLTRTFSGTSTRRRFGGLLTALGLGAVAGLGLFGAAETEAKKRHKKQKVTLCLNGQTIKVGKRQQKKQLRLGATKGACPVDTTGLQQPCTYDGQCIGDLVCQVANSQNGNPERANQPVCCVPADVHAPCEDGSDCCGVSVICNGGYCQSS